MSEVTRARAGAGIMQELMRDLDRNSLAISSLDDTLEEHDERLKALHHFLFEGTLGDSFTTRLRLQEFSGRELEAWKAAMIRRFWQVLLSILTALALMVGGLLWRQDAVMQTLELKVHQLEQGIRAGSKPPVP
jgi:hypothetical protein